MTNKIHDKTSLMDVINVNLINDNLHLCKIYNNAVINCAN